MLRVLLIRPGSTEYDRQGRIQGNLDMPLCSDGMQQVQAMLSQIDANDLQVVYCGPSESAHQTADLVAEGTGAKVKSLDDLANLDHGLWQGLLIDEVRTKQPKIFRRWQEEPQTVCPPDGEAVADACTRVERVVNKIGKKHKTGTVAIVVANPLSSIVRHVLTDDQLCDLWNPSNQLASWEVIGPRQAISPAT